MRDPDDVRRKIQQFFVERRIPCPAYKVDDETKACNLYPEVGDASVRICVLSDGTWHPERLEKSLREELRRYIGSPEVVVAPPSTQGVKYDQGKPDYTLLTMRNGLDRIVRVLEYGANKYSPDNWRRVEGREKRYRAAAMRHLLADIQSPGSVDPETGESHLAHAACCLLFLLDEMGSAKDNLEGLAKRENG